jgi:hypothetical protein
LKNSKLILISIVCLVMATSCIELSSDDRQRIEQEKILMEGTTQVGMPAIKNFREKRLLKDILEMRDQEGLITYVYWASEFQGKLVFLGEAIGYGIPYSTQFTNPQKRDCSISLPQADPNGLFSPGSAEGTWVLLKDPSSGKTSPVYIEPRIVVSPFKLKGAHIIYPD